MVLTPDRKDEDQESCDTEGNKEEEEEKDGQAVEVRRLGAELHGRGRGRGHWLNQFEEV